MKFHKIRIFNYSLCTPRLAGSDTLIQARCEAWGSRNALLPDCKMLEPLSDGLLIVLYVEHEE